MTTTAVDAPPKVTSEVGVRKVLTWGSVAVRAADTRALASIQLTGGLRGSDGGIVGTPRAAGQGKRRPRRPFDCQVLARSRKGNGERSRVSGPIVMCQNRGAYAPPLADFYCASTSPLAAKSRYSRALAFRARSFSAANS